MKKLICSVLRPEQEQAAAGFEPPNDGFANRRPKITTSIKTKTCKFSKQALTNQLANKNKK